MVHRITLLSFFLLLIGLVTTTSALAGQDNPRASIHIENVQEKKLLLLQPILQKLCTLIGTTREDPFLLKLMGKPARAEMCRYWYLYPLQCTKVRFDDVFDDSGICYASIDHHPYFAQVSSVEIEKQFGEPDEKTMEEEGAYYKYKLRGYKGFFPVLFFFKSTMLETVSIFPPNF